MERRHFFKTLGGAAGSLIFAASAPAFSTVNSIRKKFERKPIEESSWKFLRKQFLLPKGYAYFNTGGIGSSPLTVIDTVKRMMVLKEITPAPGHDEEDWWKIREKCAAFLGPGIKKEEIALTGTATEGINIILNGLPLEKGDEIITSTHEHVALNAPLLNKMKTHGVVLKTVEPDLVDPGENVTRIEKAITKRTRLIFISHVTCTTGQVFPVKEIGRLARSMGIWFALDGAQAMDNIPFHLIDTGADFYAFSGHKWILGPKRTGILYVRENLLEQLKPSIVGAFSIKQCEMENRQFELLVSAQRYEYGTQNDALVYGLGEALDFNTAIGAQNVWKHNRYLAESFSENIAKIPAFECISPTLKDYRSSMIAIQSKNYPSERICNELYKKQIRVRHISEARLEGIRISFHVYNNENDVERLLYELKKER